MILGIDTSNYTTSVALYDEKNNKMYSFKKLLPVKQGEKGLRQSDAVFYHTMQIRDLLKSAFDVSRNITAIGVSVRPCDFEGSYMPCFMVGQTVAKAIAGALNVPLYEFSHQRGHIAAALFSADRLDLIGKKFAAFHFSGGTSDALLVSGDDDLILSVKVIAQSSDLKAGQAIDRAGVMLGLPFPSGNYIDRMAQNSDVEYRIKPSFSYGNPSFSGIENKCKKLLDDGTAPNDIAKFVVSYIAKAVDTMTADIIGKYGDIPLIYAGGVMCNTTIRKVISSKYKCSFADPEFSSDNAAGAAVLASVKERTNEC